MSVEIILKRQSDQLMGKITKQENIRKKGNMVGKLEIVDKNVIKKL